MKLHSFPFAKAIASIAVLLIWGAHHQTICAADPPKGRIRVLIETDAGGDPDDEQSLVRFLLYANEWDVTGIIANRPLSRDGENLNPERTGLGVVRRLVKAYGDCYPSLVKHDPRYPSADDLLKRSIAGYDDTDEAVKLIIAEVDSPDPRPLWYSDWGTDNGTAKNNLWRALDRVQRERGEEGYAKFKSRLRLSSADKFGEHTTKLAPPFPFWVDTFRPELERKRWYHRFSAITATAGGFDLKRDVLMDHGPLGALYPINTTHVQKEGDSMTFLYLIPTGMNDPEQPGWGSWGGRYGRNPEHPDRPYYWANQQDAWQESTNRDNTLRRWAADLQNDFRARLDWCVKSPKDANHAPLAVLNNRQGKTILQMTAAAGEEVVLDAAGSSDPDSQDLTYEWFAYREAGTYAGNVLLHNADKSRARLQIPADASGKSIHVVLTVRDRGTPPLASYRRAVISVAAKTAAALGQQLQAGAATSNITPPLGKDIIGGFQPFPSKHVHDELHVRCLVLDDGKTRLALVVCDLLGIHRSVSDEARRLIQESTGISPEHVLISATHTHSASSALGQDRFKHDQKLDEYQQFVARRIADAVKIAVNRLRPAEIGFGTAQAPEHVFNRRWYLKPGTMPLNPFGELDQVKMNPGAGSPNLLEPAGPTDPTISFLAVRGRDGKPISVLAAYSLHYVGGVGDGHISADYFGMFCSHMSRLLEAEHQDPPFVALLANGTSGDINNINFRQPRPQQDSYVQMRTVAEDIAAKVHRALGKVEYKNQVRLDARYRELPLAWRRPTPEQSAWAKTTLEKAPAAAGKRDLSAIYAERTQRMAEYPEAAQVPLQVLRIGDVCLTTMPCEVFCEIGLEFKSRSPLKNSFLVSLNHGYFGYLPTPRQHRLGGYETWLGTNRLEPQASDKMLESLLEMAAEVKVSLDKP